MLKGESSSVLCVGRIFTLSVVIQIMVSQTIAGYMTWNISQRSRNVGIFLLVFGLAITAVEWYANIVSRVPVQKDGK